ncbi:MAG: tyrosine-type recombinase/integrase [Selenomonadaceae bacterium]|nr:tyrosine-type recombinase/integrase [Selenomonadaceae bacterium]MBR0101958.1 tyrosine-type recombinase/integrase [Selenomonadaceae bacterium]
MTMQMTVKKVETAAVVVGNNPFSKATFADWIAFCDVKPATQVTYNKVVCNFAAYLASNGISQPTREDVIGYRKFMTDEDNNGANAIYKPSTARVYMTVVKKFFSWLASTGKYLNVAAGVKLPEMPTDEHARDALTLEEARATISSFTGKSEIELRDKAIMSLMIGCGLRSCEIVRLDLGDVEKRRGMWFLKIHGKKRAGKVDSVALSGALKKILDNYLAVRPAGKKGSPMFISTSRRCRGARLETQTISRLAKKTFVKIGVESDRVTCHSCRHAHATLALQNGVSLREVSKNLRHRGGSRVTEVYLHDLDKFNNRSVATVSKLIFS